MQKGFLYSFFSHRDYFPKAQIFLIIYTDFVLDQSGRSAANETTRPYHWVVK